MFSVLSGLERFQGQNFVPPHIPSTISDFQGSTRRSVKIFITRHTRPDISNQNLTESDNNRGVNDQGTGGRGVKSLPMTKTIRKMLNGFSELWNHDFHTSILSQIWDNFENHFVCLSKYFMFLRADHYDLHTVGWGVEIEHVPNSGFL